MLRGMVISSGSMPFSTNVIFKSERNYVCPNTIMEKASLAGFLAANFIKQKSSSETSKVPMEVWMS